MFGWLELTGLLGLIAAAGYWLDAMRGKELARMAGRRACENAGVQFLDDSVVLTRLRLKRIPHGALAFWRGYRFEFSVDGAGRHPGWVIVHGQRTWARTQEAAGLAMRFSNRKGAKNRANSAT